MSTDGDGDNHLAGITPDGTAHPLERSQMGSEFTGPTFSPDGAVLFAGIQKPGLLFAITGPWQGPAPTGRTDQRSTAGMSERSEETGSSRRGGASQSPAREGVVG